MTDMPFQGIFFFRVILHSELCRVSIYADYTCSYDKIDVYCFQDELHVNGNVSRLIMRRTYPCLNPTMGAAKKMRLFVVISAPSVMHWVALFSGTAATMFSRRSNNFVPPVEVCANVLTTYPLSLLIK